MGVATIDSRVASDAILADDDTVVSPVPDKPQHFANYQARNTYGIKKNH